MLSWWTTSYSVEVSTDGSSWDPVRDTDGSVLTFAGNTDRNTHVSNSLPDGLTARFVRVNILGNAGSIPVLRLGVMGC